ncbi:HIT family protein [Pseudomonas marincola]|uniref:HIT family protein n=1 Tax=Pseudomonas marincola TaxID=437900 RepID=UPI0008E58E5E|nr:HIT family protein [Pseudomonas marincola]SFU05010.1 histidine triad (HIT) family protein [Pseudomonas marincola]
MSLHGSYDSENIFAKIIRGDAPCYKIYEDDDVLAFLDLFPQSYGHTLVIPKHVEARNLLDIEPEKLSQLITVVQRLAQVLTDELEPAGVQIAQFNGAPAGQTVFHLHFHVIPRFAGEDLAIHASNMADNAELEALQARLQQRIAAL